jgi:hypothetical protein
MAIDQILDLVLRCAGTEHFCGREIDMLKQLRPIEHSGVCMVERPFQSVASDNPYPKKPQRARGFVTLARVKFHSPEGAEISFFHLHLVKLALGIEIAARADRAAISREGEAPWPSPLKSTGLHTASCWN